MKPSQPSGDQTTGLIEPLEFDFATPAYAEFSQRLDEQLTQLVALWQHLAAPRALLAGRSGNICLPARS